MTLKHTEGEEVTKGGEAEKREGRDKERRRGVKEGRAKMRWVVCCKTALWK